MTCAVNHINVVSITVWRCIATWHISREIITTALSTLQRTIESKFSQLLCFNSWLTFFVIFSRILSCGILETPRFGRKSNFQFTPGAVVTFECNEGFFLNGDRRRTCGEDGRWDLPQYGYTECLREFLFTNSLLVPLCPAIILTPPSKNEHLFKSFKNNFKLLPTNNH